MCDSINETLKLKQQDKAKLILYILHHINKLNNFLKCCICFELFDNPTKTNCGHVFCKSCIKEHMSYYSSEEVIPCPICMQPLAEFESFSLHLQYKEAVEFVQKLLEHTTNFPIGIKQPPNFKSILEKIEQNTTEKEVELSNEMTNFESDSRYKSILRSRKFLISTDSKVFLSENSSDNLSNNPVDDMNTIRQINNLQTEVNPFDMLLSESKKLKPIKTYGSAKKPQKEVITTEIEKSIKVGKRSGTGKALQWLQDTRNNFENLPTQTETIANLKETIPKFDLPSISQNHKPQFNLKPNTMNQNKIRRLTRSMGGSSKVAQAKTRERHSIAACDNLSIPISIEQFSSEEVKNYTKELKDLELECLNNIDKEMLQAESSAKETIKPEKLNKEVCVATNSDVIKRTRKGKDTLNASSSLDKFKEMKKIISKTDRKLKKLPVVINSGPTLCKVVTSAASTINVSDQPIVIIEQCNLVNNRPVASSSKRKIDKANVMDNEIYNFSKPLNKTLTRIDYASNSNKLQNSERPGTPYKKFSKTEKSKRTPGLKIKSSKIKDVDSPAAKEMETKNTNILTEETNENDKEKHESDCDENNFNKLTQSMNETVRRVDTSNIDNDIFNVLTQSLIIEPHKFYEPDKQPEELDLPQHLNELMTILTNTVGVIQTDLSQLNSKKKEYVGNFINNTLKAINTPLHPVQEVTRVKDVFVQSCLPIANLVDLAIQTDPSILSLENNLAEIGIQTDFDSPQRGLYITSTDMFNTPSVVDAEIQTDFLPCSNCNHQKINSATKVAERIILSESFDNIQFETQDMLKGNHKLELRLQPRTSSSSKISNLETRASADVPSPTCKATKDTSKRKRTQNSTDDMFAKDDGFDNIQFDTQEILKDKSNIEVQLPSSNKNCEAETTTLSNTKSPRRTSKRLCKSNLTDQLLEKDDGFEKLQFIKTQDFLKDKHNLKVQSSPASSYKSPRRTSKRLRIPSSAEDKNFETEIMKGQQTLKEHLQPRTPTSSTKKSEVGFSTCNPPRRTSKRLRTHSTPEEELLPKDIKRNKYLNEDASLQFLSEEISSSNHPIEFDDSGFSKYEECLDNVLKNYDASKNPKKVLQTISKTQNAIRECHVIIDNACSEAITIENTENLDKTVKYVKQNPSPCTLLILQDEFSKDFDNTSKIVKTSETRKEALQSDRVEKSIEKHVPGNLVDNFKEIDMSIENISNHPSESTNIENRAAVILQNTVVSKKNDAALIEELNKSLDDVFLSDSDVVETTPQKSNIVSCEELLTQAYYNPVAPVALPPLVENSPDVILSSLDPPLLTCLNMTFAPPPEFQDLDNPEDTNDLDESPDVTLKPESDSVQIVHDGRPTLSSVTPDLFMETNNMVTSTPAEASQIISHSLNLSPIRPTCQDPFKLQNPIEAAHSSMISPLNVVKSQNNVKPKNSRSFITSTPRQKSILNFIKNKKPCVTCTRLSKPEVAIIRTLSEKNMFTYSVNFNPSVTHLIVSVDEQQCLCDQTMKYVSAVAAGIWIVSFNWIQECVIRDQIPPEEQFEVLDISGIDGPKLSRLNRISNPLFRGYKIYISPPFRTVVERDIKEVIMNLGGEIVPNMNDLLKKNGKICIIIAEAKSSKDFEMYNSWLEKLKVITVEMEWLSRSVGQYEIVNFRHFALCSDENISDLGYPPELTSNLPVNSRSAFSNM